MTLSALGIFSAAGAGGVAAGAYELIETVVLGSSLSTVTFSNLGTYSSTYKHLQIRMAYKLNSETYGTYTRFNGDTGSNYSWHTLEGNGSSVSSAATANASSIITSVGGPQTSVAVMDILDAYSTTKYKTARTMSGAYNTLKFAQLFSGSWRNTASLTSISMTVDVTSFTSGSRFSIYGIKG